MLFGRDKRGPHPGVIKSLGDRIASEKREPVLKIGAPDEPLPVQRDGMIQITYGMMKKGSLVNRKGEEIRQILVMVGNGVKLVNSGDMVDHATYESLVRMGVIEPIPDMEPNPPSDPAAAGE